MTSKKTEIGVTRNLTEVFTLLKSNAFHNRNVFVNNDVITDERMSLVRLEEGLEIEGDSAPQWVHTADEVDFEFGRIRTRMADLEAAQRKHISRPNFGDEAFEQEEKHMESITEQITAMMTHSQRLIGMITTQGARRESVTTRRLRENVVSSLTFTLSELTSDFRTKQSRYLNDVKKRTRHLDDFLVTTSTAEETWGELVDVTPSQELTMTQIQQLMMNEKEVKEREKEVLAVNSSINELNLLFKDLSSMVIDQGTILDRIDYNVEQASLRVTKAVESVNKAERHQRADKKMHCIFILAILIIIVLILIIFTKF